MNKKGFTLVEVISVIVIIGILMLIAIPAVSSYILSSRKASYAADIHAFVETIKGKYDDKSFGSYVRDDEVMIVPMNTIDLEIGNSNESPFGPYDFTRTYAIVLTEYNKYQIYVNTADTIGYGIVMKSINELSKENVEFEVKDKITPWSEYINPRNFFSYRGKSYTLCETRHKGADGIYSSSNQEIDGNNPVLILCED